MWTSWYNAMLSIGSLKTYELHKPLGKWLPQIENSRQQWEHYFHQKTQLIYKKKPSNIYEVWENTNWMCTRQVGTTLTVPSAAIPVDVIKGKITPPEWSPIASQTPSIISIETAIDSYVRTAPYFHGEAYCLDDITWTEVSVALREGVLVASDGSAANRGGSFGWVIANMDGKILLQGTGDLFGIDISSFRAELEGALAVFTILYICQSILNPDHTIVGTIFIDNQATIDKITTLQDYIQQTLAVRKSLKHPTKKPLINPCNTTDPDWDKLNGIFKILQHMELESIRVEWVKAHQDRENDYDDLETSAKLNVTADALASRSHLSPQYVKPIIPPDEDAHCHLVLAGKTITSHYKSKIRYHATAPPLKEYILTRFNWSEETYHTINWSAHQRAISITNDKRRKYTKLIFNKIPTNNWVSKFESFRTPACIRCGHDTEDFEHVIKCHHSDAWFAEFLKVLSKHLKLLKTEPGLAALLIMGITAWRNGDNEIPLDTDEHRGIISSQNRIGWVELFRGRFSNGWATLQSEFYHKSGLARTGDFWTSSVITTIWGEWEHLWDIRNDAQHGTDKRHRNTIRRQYALEKLRHIYNRRDDLLPIDRSLLYDSIEEHETKPTSTIENWINMHWDLFQASWQEAEKNSTANTNPITKFFHHNKPSQSTTSQLHNSTSQTKKHRSRKMIAKLIHPITKFFRRRQATQTETTRQD